MSSIEEQTEKAAPVARRRVLGPVERKEFKREIERNQADIDGKLEGLSDVSPKAREALDGAVQGNTRYLKQRNQRIMNTLRNGEPEEVSRHKMPALERRRKELEDFMKTRMVPRAGTRLRAGSGPEFRRAVNMMAKNELRDPSFSRATVEWKNIMRQIAPDDPDASNLENIRPEDK